MEKKNIIDWLFSTDNETAETKEIKMTRLSKIKGEDVIFTIKSLGFDDICHYRAIQDDSRRQIAMVLAGVLSPNLRDKDAYRAAVCISSRCRESKTETRRDFSAGK